MPDDITPLSEEDKKAVLAALEQLKAVNKALSDAKRAGIDVSSLEEQAKSQQTALEGIRRVYIPSATGVRTIG